MQDNVYHSAGRLFEADLPRIVDLNQATDAAISFQALQ